MVAAASLGGCKGNSESAPLTVAAAADLSLAFREVASAYEGSGGKKVTLAFGSTGLMAKQIVEGAPYDVFAAANVSFVDDVLKGGRCDGKSVTLYARGRIAVWMRPGEAGPPPKTLEELADPRWKRIALANPEHAP